MSVQGTILVTGGTGFVGSHLIEKLLERNRNVRCLVRHSSNLRYVPQDRVELIFGGLDEETDWDAALDGVDTIYHVAGLTFARRKQDYFYANHKTTETIIAAALPKRRSIRKFVLISSLAAVGPCPDSQPFTEEVNPAPISTYGKSKLLAEESARAVSDLLPITIVRPPAIYGPRDYAILEIFKLAARGILPLIGRQDKLLSLVHVRDLAEGIVLAGESEKSAGQTYFLSSEEIYSWGRFAEALSAVTGSAPRTLRIPRSLAYVAALLAESFAAFLRRPPVINREKVKELSQLYWICSPEKAKRELGYRQNIPLEEGIRETAKWYREQKWL